MRHGQMLSLGSFSRIFGIQTIHVGASTPEAYLARFVIGEQTRKALDGQISAILEDEYRPRHLPPVVGLALLSD